MAREITVLATPGSVFVFKRTISALDMHSGTLVVDDPLDEKGHHSFNSVRLPVSHNLHQGDRVMVTAEFDGTRYVATPITSN